MKAARVILGLSCLITFLSLQALGVAPGKETDAELLPGSKYKFAVLEYESPEQSKWGLELSRILTQEIIGSIRHIPGVGVVNLERAESRAARDWRAVGAIAQRQKAAVVIWGEIFEADRKIYLHSHLSIFPKVNSWHQSLELSVQTAAGPVQARPPALLVNFAPVEIPIESVTALQNFHREANTLRVGPMHNAAENGQVHPHDTYSVSEVEGPWMKIRLDRGLSGWVRYANLEMHPSLSELKAIVLFAQAAMHYLAGNFDPAANTFSAYLTRYGEKQDPVNRGLANILHANAQFKAFGFDRAVPREESISARYLEAARLMPNQAAPINYLAVLRVKKYEHEKKFVPEMRDLELRLIDALQKEPNPDSINNLRAIYTLAGRSNLLQTDKMDSDAYAAAISRQMKVLDHLSEKPLE